MQITEFQIFYFNLVPGTGSGTALAYRLTTGSISYCTLILRVKNSPNSFSYNKTVSATVLPAVSTKFNKDLQNLPEIEFS